MKVDNIRKHAGIAGQFEVSAQVTYEGEEAQAISFVGSIYDGPVVMITPYGGQVFVTDPQRFGKFGVPWVKNFFATREEI